MDLVKIKSVLGVENELTDENAEAVICASFDTVDKRVVDLEAELKAARAGEAKNEPPHPEVIRLSAENHRLRLKELVGIGAIKPVVRDALDNLFIGQQCQVLSLSLTEHTNIVSGVLEALKENAGAVKPGEKTGPQLLSLSGGKGSATEEEEAKAVHERMENDLGMPNNAA